jgi:hypothetical protein
MLTITYPVPTHEWVTPQVRKLSSGILEPRKKDNTGPDKAVQLRFLSFPVNSLWITIFVGRADSCIKYDELERTLVLLNLARGGEKRVFGPKRSTRGEKLGSWNGGPSKGSPATYAHTARDNN